MPTTPNHALRYPVLGDAPNVPLDLQRLAQDAETALDGLDTRLDTVENRVKPMVRIESTADFAISNSNNAVLDFAGASISYDTNSMADLANDRIVIQTTGLYRLTAFVPFTNNSTGYRTVLIQRNGTEYLGNDYRMAVNGSSTLVTVTTEPLLLTATDYLQLRAIQTSGAAMTLSAQNGRRYMLAAEFVAFADGTIFV